MSKANRGQVASGSYVLTWKEEDQARLGEGISRPHPKQKTSSFKVVVTPPAGARMTAWLQAPDLATALVYAMNRWPTAKIAAAE